MPHLLTKCSPVVLTRVLGARLRFSILSVLAFLGHSRDFEKIPKLGVPAHTSEIRASERAAQARTLFRTLWMNSLGLLITDFCLFDLLEPSACDVYVRSYGTSWCLSHLLPGRDRQVKGSSSGDNRQESLAERHGLSNISEQARGLTLQALSLSLTPGRQRQFCQGARVTMKQRKASISKRHYPSSIIYHPGESQTLLLSAIDKTSDIIKC